MIKQSSSSDWNAHRHRIRQLEAEGRLLDPDARERDRLLKVTHGYAQGLLNELSDRLAYGHEKSAASHIRDLPIGEATHRIEALVDLLDEAVVRTGILPAHPGHVGYIPGGGIYASALADYLADVTNEYVGVWFAGPGAVEIENATLAWMADLVGYPVGAAGNLASGGSIASLIAVVTAREAAALTPADYEGVVIYSTSHGHHCVEKAVYVAGLGKAVHRQVALDERYRMVPESLVQLIAADRAAGLRPWLILASAGTTDVGAIDPLAEIAEIARREDLWFHVDAAYGAFFALVDECRPRLEGMERSDSIVLDPHKGLFLPYGTGAVLVRDGQKLRDAHGYDAPYLQDMEAAEENQAPAALSPELTKHWRGLRVWLPLLLHGVEPFRACLEEKLELARYFYGEIKKLGFEVGPKPELSVVTFRWVPENGDANAFNRALVREIHRDGRIFLSSTMIEGKFTLRLAVLVFRTHLDTIDLMLALLRDLVVQLEASAEDWLED